MTPLSKRISRCHDISAQANPRLVSIETWKSNLAREQAANQALQRAKSEEKEA
jgi:hypothetical protein